MQISFTQPESDLTAYGNETLYVLVFSTLHELHYKLGLVRLTVNL